MRIEVHSTQRQELIDITADAARAVAQSGVQDGLCLLFCRHTTAGLTVNENADPDVKRDLLLALDRIVADDWPYRHAEGNSPAHVKSSLLGASLAVPVSGGKLALGTWQGILFAEFDGPRRGRSVEISVISVDKAR